MGSSPFSYTYSFVTQNQSDVWPASLRYRNHAVVTVLTCEQKPYPVWFSCKGKTYPVYCEHALSVLQFAVADQGRGPGGPPPIFRPKWGPKGRRNSFGRPPPPLISGSGWPPPPSPTYLKVWIRRWFVFLVFTRRHQNADKETIPSSEFLLSCDTRAP